jgi:hypothetical protein
MQGERGGKAQDGEEKEVIDKALRYGFREKCLRPLHYHAG